jgi:uncharacterized protein (TIGR02246 family)
MTRSLSARVKASERAPEIEALVADYLRVWNTKDAAAVWSRYYRLDPGHTLKSEADLVAMFESLVREGYDRTVIQSLEAWRLGPDEAVAELAYQRLKTDGEPMPPADRRSTYWLRRFEDGWRMTRLVPAGLDEQPEVR